MSERLELVTEFSALRTGMIVVIRTHATCGRSHRAILLSLVPKSRYSERGFAFEPVPPCLSGAGNMWGCRFGVGERAVADRIVYRVVDDTPAHEAQQAGMNTRRALERVKW